MEGRVWDGGMRVVRRRDRVVRPGKAARTALSEDGGKSVPWMAREVIVAAQEAAGGGRDRGGRARAGKFVRERWERDGRWERRCARSALRVWGRIRGRVL